MMKQAKRNSRILLFLTLALATGGFILSSSASLAMLGKRAGMALPFDPSQFLSLVLGVAALLIISRIPYRLWREYALPVFITAVLLTLAVFLPVIGFSHNGARRWLSLGPLSFQPAELLKFAFVIYFASWLSTSRERLATFRLGFIPYFLIIGILGAILFMQPDTGTFLIILTASLAMFIAAGGRLLHLGYLSLVVLASLGLLLVARPYTRERLITFIDRSYDTYGSSYQITQSLIAIGSGGITGRGYGQSIQKFNYLPESIGDSVFAVVGEELGFIGSLALICAFLLFVLFGLKVAACAPDSFGRLLVVGFIIIVAAGAFINIAAMLGIIPLTGVPLTFVSHGGTALFFSLAGMGVALNVSRHQHS